MSWRREAGATVIGEITLPGIERSAGRARRHARDVLGPGHPSLDDLEVCVSEMVSNAVRHTASGDGGKVRVCFVDEGGVVRVEVTDDGAQGARPHLQDDLLADSGRGLRLIDGLARRWGFHAGGVRTTVWAEFPQSRTGGNREGSSSYAVRADSPE